MEIHAQLKQQAIQLKNQSERIDRSLKNSSHAKTIQDAFSSMLQPEQLSHILNQVTAAVAGNSNIIDNSDIEKPQLQSLKTNDASGQDHVTQTSNNTSSTSAKMTELLGELAAILSQADYDKLNSLLNGYNKAMEGQASTYSDLAKKLEEAAQTWATDKDALDQATEDDTIKNQQLKAAQDAYNQAKAAFDHASPADKQKAQKTLDEAQAKLTVAQSACATADKNLSTAKSIEQASRLTLNTCKEQSENLISSLTRQQTQIIESNYKEAEKTSKSMTFLLAVIAKIIDKNANEKLSAQSELNQKLSEAAEADAKQKAEEYQKELDKAEQAQKTMGCIGKAIGWITAIVGFVGAAFTGGASLALAAVGLALMAADAVDQAVTGNSFLDAAMKPIMEQVTKLINLVAKEVSKLLEKAGVDHATAQIIGNVIGAVAVVTALIAAAVVGSAAVGSAIGSIAGKVGEKCLENSVMKEIVRVVEEMIEKMADSSAMKGIKSSLNVVKDSAHDALKSVLNKIEPEIANSSREVQAKWVGNVMNRAQVGIGTAGAVNETALNITVSAFKLEAAKKQADIMSDITEQNLLKELMKITIDGFKHQMETMNAIIQNMTDAAQQDLQTGLYIASQMKSSRAS